MAKTPGTNYPQIPSSVWWGLRERLIQSVPGKVTESFLATILKVKTVAARQYIYNLRDLGLIDKENKPTKLMQNWRNDAKYKEVCAEILRAVYPQELLDVAPPPTPNRDEVINWFMHDAQLGLGTAKNKAATYLLIAAGDASKQHDRSGKKRAPQKEAKQPAAQRALAKAVAYAEPALATTATSESQGRSGNVRISPALQLNIQIHISPETSTDQIDAIFASMARYFRDQH